MRKKEIWSNRYGKNPKEGLHKWLEKNVPNYKRNHLSEWIKGFAQAEGRNCTSVDFAQSNFKSFTSFVLSTINNPLTQLK